MSKKYTLEQVRTEIQKRNGILLSNEYINCKIPLQIKCINNHIFNTRFNNIIQGSWCKFCAKNVKYDISQVKKIIESYDFQLISKTYISNHSIINIKCKFDHIFKTTLSDFKRKKKCSVCNKENLRKKLSLSYDFVKNEIDKKNGKLLSKEYINARTPLKIECLACNNIWKNRFDNIKNGQWCPRCNSRKHQKLLTDIISKIYPSYTIKINFKGFWWLETKSGYKQEFDIFIPELKLAIEYDGEQHFVPVRFGGISLKKATERLKYIKGMDKIKNKKIKEHSDDIKYFIRFNYKENINKKYVVKKLLKNKVSLDGGLVYE